MRPGLCGVGVRWGARLPCAWRGSRERALQGPRLGWSWESPRGRGGAETPREGTHCWGAGGQVGGVLPRVRVPSPGLTLLPLPSSLPGNMSEGNAAGEPSAPGGPRTLLSGARGLIGRRPAPPLTPGRLPSIRSRDLTLGGVKKVPDYLELQAAGVQSMLNPHVHQAWWCISRV